MKHTKNYMDAVWVIENPERYDDRDVVRANAFIEAYNEGYNQALSLGAVVGQSKQLVCDVCNEDGWISENKGDIIEHRLCKCDKAN